MGRAAAPEKDKAPVGGQAVLEGVMMRGDDVWTVTVRTPDGGLKSKETLHKAWRSRNKLLGLPLVRGPVVLLDSLVIGMKALNYSAEVAVASEPAEAPSASASAPPAPEPRSSAPPAQKVQDPKKPTFGTAEMVFSIVAGVGLALVLFVAAPHVLSLLMGKAMGFDERGLVFHLVDGLLKFAILILYIWGIGQMREIGRLYAYHGAEHKAIHVFEAKLPLLPESAAPFPTWHPRCGTAFLFLVLALSVLFFAIIFPLVFRFESLGRVQAALAGVGIKILLTLPLSALAYELTRLAGRHEKSRILGLMIWPGLLLQRLTTREPDRSQLEVAFSALESVLARRPAPALEGGHGH
jgi:uncharacterized protein YqhQ